MAGDDEALRDDFALAYVRHDGNAYAAAREIIEDIGAAIVASERWPREPGFSERVARIKREAGEEAFLPTIGDLARELWDMGRNAAVEPRERIAALKLYADVRGFVKRPEAAAPANVTTTTNNVLVVPAHGDGWEHLAMAQQAKLIDAK